MTDSYSGEIVITKNLFPKIADQGFLTFTGLGMNESVAGAFSENDLEVIKNAPEKLNDGKFSSVLNIRRNDGVYCEALVGFEGVQDDEGLLIRMKISAISDLIESRNQLKTAAILGDAYYDLLGAVMLRYICVSRRLEIFYVSDLNRRSIFEGTLEEWKAHMSDGSVEKEYEEEFAQLCGNMASAKKNFSHTLKINGFLGGKNSDICLFRCRTVSDAEGNDNVIGWIEMGSKESLKNLIIDPINDKDAFLDMLNKRAVIEHAKRIISMPTLKRSYFIIVDLDNFKSVNDVYGHIMGDAVLVNVTKIINDNLGGRGIVGRVGGDEILIITETIEEQTELRNMLRSIRTAVEWAFKTPPTVYNVTCSIGVCAYPDNGKDFDTLFELADKMLYIAKSKGKNRYIIYTPELHDKLIKEPSEQAAAVVIEPKKDLQNDKIGIMHRLVDNYLIRHSYNNEKMFSEIGEAFSLGEILMVYENFTNLFKWTPEGGVTTDISNVPYYKPEESFGELFNDDKLLVLDALFKLEGRCPELQKFLEETGVKSALFYKIDRMGSLSGYVMYGKSEQRQKWSDNEIMALSTAAKVFDVSMRD